MLRAIRSSLSFVIIRLSSVLVHFPEYLVSSYEPTEKIPEALNSTHVPLVFSDSGCQSPTKRSLVSLLGLDVSLLHEAMKPITDMIIKRWFSLRLNMVI